LLLDHEFGVVCQDQGQVCFGFVHAVIIGTGFAALGVVVCHPFNWSRQQQFVRKSAQLHGVTELSGEEFSAIE
jgi:hypothetical protein